MLYGALCHPYRVSGVLCASIGAVQYHILPLVGAVFHRDLLQYLGMPLGNAVSHNGHLQYQVLPLGGAVFIRSRSPMECCVSL